MGENGLPDVAPLTFRSVLDFMHEEVKKMEKLEFFLEYNSGKEIREECGQQS